MFEWIKKLTCERSVNLTCERSVKYYYAREVTAGRPDQGKYYTKDEEGKQWEYIYTCVVYALCTKSHEKKEVQEFFGENATFYAERLVKKLNNL